MTNSGTTASSPTAIYVRHWLRANLGILLSYLGLFISTIVLLVMFLQAARRGEFHYIWANLLPMAYVIGWLTLITTPVRTVGWRLIARAFFMGVFVTMAISYPLDRIMKIPFGNNLFTQSMWVPVMEEIGKLVVLLGLWWLLNRRATRRTGVADMMVLGATLGLGFSFHEDMLYPRAMSAFSSPSFFGGFFEPWGLVFPTAAYAGGEVGMGHLSAGIGIGIAVGLAFAIRGKFRIIAVVLGAGLWLLEVMFHGIWNAFDLAPWLRSGIISAEPWVHLVLIAAAIGFDLARRRLRPPATAVPALRWYQIAHRNAEDPLRWVERMMVLSRFRREWNGGAYARAANPGLPDLSEDHRLLHWFLLGTGRPRGSNPHAAPH